MSFKSGFVAIVGRPNAGKSTLLNALVGHKVAIVSPVAQTTRNRIRGYLHRDDAQIVLIDTPGFIRRQSALGRYMMDELQQALDGIDILALIVDASRPFGPGDIAALDRASAFHGKRFLLLNKIDAIAKEKLLPLMQAYGERLEFAEIIPISARDADGLPLLVNKMVEYLPEGPPYFPADEYTDQPERVLAAEIVREKVLHHTREEVPHGVAVLVDNFEEGEKLVRILATVMVEREGHKGIVIGKGGAVLKAIGTEARRELEKLLGVKIFLELHVKVQHNWRENPALVRELDWRRQFEQQTEE
jgi:GTP-binding protein Era